MSSESIINKIQGSQQRDFGINVDALLMGLKSNVDTFEQKSESIFREPKNIVKNDAKDQNEERLTDLPKLVSPKPQRPFPGTHLTFQRSLSS